MYGLFTPLINRPGLSQMLACPGHTHENWCAGGALALARLPDNRDWHCLVLYQEAQFPAWTLFCHCRLHTLQHQAPEATRGRIHRKGARVLPPNSPLFAKLFPEVLTPF